MPKGTSISGAPQDYVRKSGEAPIVYVRMHVYWMPRDSRCAPSGHCWATGCVANAWIDFGQILVQIQIPKGTYVGWSPSVITEFCKCYSVVFCPSASGFGAWGSGCKQQQQHRRQAGCVVAWEGTRAPIAFRCPNLSCTGGRRQRKAEEEKKTFQ